MDLTELARTLVRTSDVRSCDLMVDSFHVRVSTITAIYTIGHRFKSKPTNWSGYQRPVIPGRHPSKYKLMTLYSEPWKPGSAPSIRSFFMIDIISAHCAVHLLCVKPSKANDSHDTPACNQYLYARISVSAIIYIFLTVLWSIIGNTFAQ